MFILLNFNTDVKQIGLKKRTKFFLHTTNVFGRKTKSAIFGVLHALSVTAEERVRIY